MIPFSQLLLQAQALSANVAGKTAVFWSGDKDGTPTNQGLAEKCAGLYPQMAAGPSCQASLKFQKTDYVVAGRGAGGKLGKAAELGVKVLTEE